MLFVGMCVCVWFRTMNNLIKLSQWPHDTKKTSKIFYMKRSFFHIYGSSAKSEHIVTNHTHTIKCTHSHLDCFYGLWFIVGRTIRDNFISGFSLYLCGSSFLFLFHFGTEPEIEIVFSSSLFHVFFFWAYRQMDFEIASKNDWVTPHRTQNISSLSNFLFSSHIFFFFFFRLCWSHIQRCVCVWNIE